jgi:hypothetical protein
MLAVLAAMKPALVGPGEVSPPHDDLQGDHLGDG